MPRAAAQELTAAMAVDYRLAVLDGESGPEAGIVVGDLFHPTEAASALSRGASWADSRAALARVAAEPSGWRELDPSRLRAPLAPRTIFCAAANYVDHHREMTKREPPAKDTISPYFFTKVASTVAGPNDELRLPARSHRVDWEGEIGVVIGRRARSVPVAEAMSCVAGYVVANDISARDHLFRDDWPDFRSDWLRMKSFDGACPIGPWLTPADAIADPHALAIRTWVNDALMQDGRSSDMIFSIPEQIAYLTEELTLHPGDLILTGTPAGCGQPRGIFLQPGDTVTVEIEGLGRLRNTLRG